jgi:hypothetical protein
MKKFDPNDLKKIIEDPELQKEIEAAKKECRQSGHVYSPNEWGYAMGKEGAVVDLYCARCQAFIEQVHLEDFEGKETMMGVLADLQQRGIIQKIKNT